MKVTFIDPVTDGTYDCSKPSDFGKIPRAAGVYIYGLKLPFGRKSVFTPLYVGTAENLRSRISQHYGQEKTGGNSKKEIFQLFHVKSLIDLEKLYSDMNLYAKLKGMHRSRLVIPTLIWFNNRKFFDIKLGLSSGTSTYPSHSGHRYSIRPGGDLDTIKTHQSANLKKEILNTKSMFDYDYYFIYAELKAIVGGISVCDRLYENSQAYERTPKYKSGHGEYIAKRVEQATKIALQSIHIYTTAKADGDNIPMEIDLTAVQDSLVNTGIHPFGYPKYKKPLIITVKN